MHHLDDSEERTPSGPHVQAQQHYYEMRQRHDIAKRTTAEAFATMKAAESELIERMMDLGISRLDYMDDGTRIHFQGRCSVSVTQANEHEVREFLRDTYGDDAPFSKDTLNKSAITDRIREGLKSSELSETDVPDTMKLNQYPGLSVTGWQER